MSPAGRMNAWSTKVVYAAGPQMPLAMKPASKSREHLPTVDLVALGHVLREGELDVAVDGDAVVVPRPVRDALLKAGVAHDAEGATDDDAKARLVVHRGGRGLSCRE